MSEKTEKKKLSILRVLQEAEKPIGSTKIMEYLQAMGQDVSERTIRYYLFSMDEEGLTENLGKKGRVITDLGRKELESARIIEKVGFLAARIDQLAYGMNFDLAQRSGTVIVNASLLKEEQIKPCIPLIKKVFEAGYSMGTLTTIFMPGERIGEVIVPEKMIGIGTVCSITLNGVLLANGIPTNSRFGGLLELKNGKPSRFVEIITYDGTSLDPLEIFIRSGMTDYVGAIHNGNGRIGVGFREIPANSREQVIKLIDELNEAGLGGFLMVGWPGQTLLEIPVSEGRIGSVVIGGLNPAAILEEKDIKIRSRALAGLVEYEKLFHFSELDDKIRGLV